MKPKSIKWSVADGVGQIVLDRPATLNSLTFEVYGELRDLFRHVATQKDIRVVTITGSGKGFCSGGDREEIIAQLFGKTSEEVYKFARMTCDLVEAMRGCPKPVIAAINGAAVGVGATMTLPMDIRLAVPGAKMEIGRAHV